MEQTFELILGRKTYEIFAANWTEIDPIVSSYGTEHNKKDKY